jgi:uncharacterized membrane protein YjjP (DUF1212 family)
MGILATIAIGVVSVLVAGLLVGGFLGFVVAVIVGVVLVAAVSHLMERNRAPRWRRAMHVD